MLNQSSNLSKLIKGVSFSWIRFALTIVIGIVQTPLLFNNLNREELNFWYIFYSFGAFLQLADLGLIQTISRLIAYIDGGNQSNKDNLASHPLSNYTVKQIYSTALFSFTFLLLILSTLASIIYLFTYNGNSISQKLFTPFIIYIIGISVNLLSNVPAAMLIGYRDVGTDSVVRSIAQICYFLLLYSLLPAYKSIEFVALMFLIQSLGQLVGLHLAFRKRHPIAFIQSSNAKKSVKLNIAKQIYTQSFPLFLNQLGGWLIAQGNILLASIVVGSNQISDFAINQQPFTYVTAIALVVNQSLSPFIARQYVQDKQDNLRHLFSSTMIICLSIASLALLILVSCGDNIISLWVGADHFLGYPYLIVFGLITFFEVQHSVAGNFVWNTGSWPFNKWTLVAGVITICLGYTLGREYGLLGIAMATLIAKLLTLNWYVVFFGIRRLKLSLKEYITHTFSPLFMLLVVTLIIVLYLKKQFFSQLLSNEIIIISLGLISCTIFSLMIIVMFRKPLLLLYKTVFSSKLEKFY